MTARARLACSRSHFSRHHGTSSSPGYYRWPYLDTGESERARALLESMRPDFETNLVWSHGWAILLAAEGKPDEARHTMDDATIKFARVAWLDTSATADLYALTGDNSKAMPPSF